jgi:apolipoprotein N-acyltransferase
VLAIPAKYRQPLAAAVASALLLWGSQPPISAGVLAWIGLVPVAVVAIRSGGRPARLAVPLAYALYLELLLVPALPFGLTEDQWGDAPVPVLVGGSPVLVVALVLVPLFGLALYALGFPAPGPPRAAWALVLVPALSWTALDFARVKLDPGGLFGPLFASQHDTFAAPVAAIGGPWLLTFAIVAFNYALALAVVRRGRSPLAVVAAALGLLVVLAPGPGDRGRDVAVAAVQPGFDTAEFDRPGRAERVLRNFHPGTYELAALDMVRDLAPLTLTAARRGAELVVWPEAALWIDPRTTSRVRRALSLLARESGTAIVVPYFLEGPDQGATVVVSPDGRLSTAQPKQRPMWFWGENGDNRVEPRPVPTAVGKVGTILGVDNQDPRPSRLLADAGAGVIASSTHDWRRLAPAQQAFARLHAVEVRAPLVRSDWRYGSAIFDRDGDRVAHAGDERRRSVVVATVDARSTKTPYVAVGDALGWTAIALALSAALIGVRRPASLSRVAGPRRRRPAPSSPS